MIITSLLDTDLYKFTMQQAVWHQFPDAQAEYVFRCRDPKADLTPFAQEIRREIDHLAQVHLTDEEADYLSGLRYIKSGYVDALKGFRFDPSDVQISTDGGQFSLRIRGNWHQSILWEVPVLSIVNETYFRNLQPGAAGRDEGTRRLLEKCDQINQAPVPLSVIEFGTRRRYSRAWQETVVQVLRDRIGNHFAGTSNVDLARRYGMKPFGTMAHEFLQAGQALAPLRQSQFFALEAWMQEYRGDLGIALSDVVGMDAFLRDFDLLFCKAYDGARQDSGDPIEWGEKLIAHYEKMGIDARTKFAVFSDSLNIPKAIAIAERFHGRIRTSFGIGTNLTNDLGFAALPIVLKLVRLNGQPVAKISDEAGKVISEDNEFLALLRKTFTVPA